MNVSKWRKRLYLVLTVIALSVTAQGLILQVFAAGTPETVEEQQMNGIDDQTVGADSVFTFEKKEEAEVPYLTGTLINSEKRLYVTNEAETFRFLICRGNITNLSDLTTEAEKLKWLSDQQIPFTVTELTVEKGSSGTDAIPLDQLKICSYSEETGQYQETEEAWNWVEGSSYTITELPQKGEFSKYIFGDINSDQQNPYVFLFDQSKSRELTVTNVRKEWNLQLLNTDSTEDRMLSGAVFGLYTKNQGDQLSRDSDLPDELNLSPEWTMTTKDGTWYLMDLQTTDENGRTRWNSLTENEYYLLEVQAPAGYRLSQDPGKVVCRTEEADVKQVNIVNASIFQIPHAGGIGTTLFRIVGICLAAGGLVMGWDRNRKLK